MDRRPGGVASVAWFDIIDYRCEIVETVRLAYSRIQSGACIPSAVVIAIGATPAPVYMNHTVGRIDAIDNECMTGSDVLSAIQNRTSGFDFILDNEIEFSLSGCLGTLLERYARIVAEVIDESCRHFDLVCARARVAELSSDTCTGMIYKSSNRI